MVLIESSSVGLFCVCPTSLRNSGRTPKDRHTLLYHRRKRPNAALSPTSTGLARDIDSILHPLSLSSLHAEHRCAASAVFPHCQKT